MKRKQRNINFLVYLFFSCALFLPPPRGATPARARASDTMTKFDSVSISHRRGRKVGDDHLGAQLKNVTIPSTGLEVTADGWLRVSEAWR